jgi:hypothetical protein
MKERDDELVKLPGGFVVRPRFVRTALRALPDHTPAEITMTIAVDDRGRADVTEIVISSARLEPFGDAELVELGALVEARDELMKIEAQEMTPNRGYTRAEAESVSGADFDRVIERDAASALRSVKTARRRRQVTPELLARVLELNDQGGIEAVVRGTNYSESYCFKLLRRAREEVAS